MLRVRLFGSGRLFDGDAEIKLPSRLWTLPLLSYVILHRGESVPRSRVAFALWPDEPEEEALQNLRRNLHRLLKALPAAPEANPWIASDAESIAWNESSDCELDVAEFERLRADPATVERATSLYSGDLLEDIYDDWVGAERERLRRLYLEDLTGLVLAGRSRRAFADAASFARRLLDADPWREDIVRQIMSVRYEAGDAAGALGEFDRFARALRAEMNVAPMPETIALRETIVRGEPIPSAAPVQGAARHGAASAPFVAREDELAHLRARWQRAASGAGGLVCVRGEAGIGKSRLVAELALIAEAEGGRVLSGITSAPERDPYQCIAAAVRCALPLLAGVSLDRALLAAVAELVPELRAYRTDIPPLARLDPESDRARRLDALAQLIVALARTRPVLIVLEDVHRAGVETLAALGEIVPRLARASVLIAATYRDDDPLRASSLRALERTPGAGEPLVVAPLDARAIGLLVEAIAPGVPATGEFLAALIERSAGNPLFLSELLRDVARAGSPVPAIPPSLVAMIDERLASLAPGSRAVAEIAAVVGEAFSVGLLRDVAGLSHADLLDGIDELLDRHLVRESSERARFEYAFTHNLVHSAVYHGVPEETRVRRHRRIARLLDEPGEPGAHERSGEIALHYERGGEAERAALHYAQAARRAATLNANVEARAALDRALRLESDDGRRFELFSLHGKMSARLADAAAEAAAQDELESLAARLDGDAACIALIRRIELEFGRGNPDAELAAIERLTQLATEAGGERWLAAAAEARARREQRNSRWDASVASALEARERYGRLGDEVASVRAAALAAQSCGFAPERAAEADRLAAEAIALAERSGDAEMRVWTLRVAASVAHEREDFGRDAALNRKALELCREFGDRRGEVACRGRLATVLWDAWQIDESFEQFREAVRLAEALGIARIAPIVCNLGGLFADVGDFASARAWCERAERLATEHRNFGVAAVASLNLAKIAWLNGEAEGLALILERAAEVVARLPGSRHEANFAKNRGRLLRCRRDFAASLAELDKAAALYGRYGRPANAAEVFDEVALTHLAAGRPEAASEALRHAEGAARQSRRGTLPDPIVHHWIDACVRRAGEDPDGARRALRCAAETYSERRDGLRDADVRASFEALPVHRALAAALENDRWPAADAACAVAFAR